MIGGTKEMNERKFKNLLRAAIYGAVALVITLGLTLTIQLSVLNHQRAMEAAALAANEALRNQLNQERDANKYLQSNDAGTELSGDGTWFE